MNISLALERARSFVCRGDEAAAKSVYLEILNQDVTHFDALTELGTLAWESGHRSAALMAYHAAAQHHPNNKIGQVHLANILMDSGEFALARNHYDAALQLDASFAEAHQGMARVLAELGDRDNEHWRSGFIGHAVNKRRYRGVGEGVPLLLLACARGGNTPVQRWIDERLFAVTVVYAEFFDLADPLPPHQIVMNAIGDCDSSYDALVRAQQIVQAVTAPVINAPSLVLLTGRDANARRLSQVRGVIAPQMIKNNLAALMEDETLSFPLLLRSPGYHGGRNFLRVDERSGLQAAAAELTGEEFLAIEYLDARGADGLWRKYRVMIIDGVLYPLHLAISADWKVHYFSSAMADNAEHRAEERLFLQDMPSVLGPQAMVALNGISTMLGLDYCGVDFALAPDGRVQVFEANATMVINPAEPDPIWDYRRPALDSALSAARTMLARRMEQSSTA